MADEAGNKPVDSSSNPKDNASSSVGKYVSPGILLFIDQLVIAAGGWLFWLVISRFATASEIGHATAIYSLVLVISSIIQFGLEYPLLKRSADQRHIFGIAMIFELAITVASIPIVIFASHNLYEGSWELALTAIGILIFSSVIFVARFALLGLSNSKAVLIFDAIGIGMRFVMGLVFISLGYKELGILLSFFVQLMVTACGVLFVARKSFGFRLDNFELAKEIIIDGFVNTPSKLSNMLMVSLSVVLLAAFGVTSSEVGIFYISVMISIVAGSFAASLAFMSIPASSTIKSDLSSGSLRLGLSFTSPIIAMMIVDPIAILSLIGVEYTAASGSFIVLAITILPAVILSNAISKFNNLDRPKFLLVIGAVRVIVFLFAFLTLVPQYGTIGAAYSILISFALSAMLSLIWSERIVWKYVVIAISSILTGITTGELSEYIIGYPSISILIASLSTFAVILALKNTSIKEIRTIVNFMKNR